MGNQGMASEEHRRLCECIWAGTIGPVREVHVWTDRPINWWPQGLHRPTYTDPVPGHVAWDLWLGPAPERPYVDRWREGKAQRKPLYHPHNWRGWWDFGPGALGDIACHAMAPAFWALKLGKPTAVQAEHSPCNAEMFPDWSIITYEFPARAGLPPVKLVWYDGGKKPPRPPELEQGRPLGDNGVLYIGERGTMLDHHLIPEEKRKQFRPPEKTIPRVASHHEDFFIACRGSRPACSNFDFAGNLTEAALVGNVAICAGQRIEWDAEAMKPKNCSRPEVLRVIDREYRKGWTL
jgi:predicted dehydrogenase